MSLFVLAWPFKRTVLLKIPCILDAEEGQKVPILGDGQTFHRPPKSTKICTAVIYKDAGHTRPFHCCHGALEQDHQRSPSRLNYHVASSAVLS